MSVVTLEQAKAYLLVTHTSDDQKIQDLIDDAEDECLQFLDREHLPRIGEPIPGECDTSEDNRPAVSDGDDLPRSLRRGILYQVQAAYEAKDADEISKLREIAEKLWFPFRGRLGT